MSSDPRVLLVGAGPTALSALSALQREYRVVGVLRRQASPATRDDVHDMAARLDIPLLHDMSIAGVRCAVQMLDPDLVVVSSYDRVLPADVLAGRPWVNVHYAPLPRYRGRAVVNWAILNGESDAYVTVHSLVPGLDAGGVLAQGRVPIGHRDTVTDLYSRLNALQEELLPSAVRNRLSGFDGEPQDEANASYCCTRVPSDGEIDWRASATFIDRLVRSLTEPYPGAFTYVGLERVRVHEVQRVVDGRVWSGRVPGRVVRVDRSEGAVDVLAGDGVVRLLRVSADDGTPVSPAALISSVTTTLGLRPAELRDELVRLRRELTEQGMTPTQQLASKGLGGGL